MARRLARRARRPRHAARRSHRGRRTAAGTTSRVAAPPSVKAASRRHGSSGLATAIAFAAVLALTLGFSWRDGPVAADPVAYTPVHDAADDVVGHYLGSGVPFGVPSEPDVAAPQARIPTARPVQILIPALDVHRAVEKVGVNKSGVLNLPVNSWNAGWYAGGPVPGAPGDAVIEGHAGYPGQPMIFGRLRMLRPGDHIIVVLADGSRQVFLVQSMTTVAVGSAPAGMADPYGEPRLTLITCTGYFDQNSYSYARRLVLNATYAGVA